MEGPPVLREKVGRPRQRGRISPWNTCFRSLCAEVHVLLWYWTVPPGEKGKLRGRCLPLLSQVSEPTVTFPVKDGSVTCLEN